MVNIVLIEDDSIMASAVKLQLRVLLDFEYDIHTFSNVSSAVDYIKITHCDILISDLNLPDSKGEDTVENFKRMDNISNIIFMSGVADELEANEISDGERIHFVMKDMEFNRSMSQVFSNKLNLKTLL